MLTSDNNQFVYRYKVDCTKNKEMKSWISWKLTISQGVLKTCACLLTFDIFGDSKPDFDELIGKVHPNIASTLG